MKKLIASILTTFSLFTFSNKAQAWEGILPLPGVTSEGAKIILLESHAVGSNTSLTMFVYDINLQPFEEDADAIRTNIALVDCNRPDSWQVFQQRAYLDVKDLGGLTVKANSNVSRSMIKAVCSLRE